MHDPSHFTSRVLPCCSFQLFRVHNTIRYITFVILRRCCISDWQFNSSKAAIHSSNRPSSSAFNTRPPLPRCRLFKESEHFFKTAEERAAGRIVTTSGEKRRSRHLGMLYRRNEGLVYHLFSSRTTGENAIEYGWGLSGMRISIPAERVRRFEKSIFESLESLKNRD